MSLLKNIKFLSSVCGAVLLITSCSTVTFPDIVEDDQANTGGEIVQESSDGSTFLKLPEESKSLKADTKNAAYEGGEDESEEDVEADVDEMLSDDDIDAPKDESKSSAGESVLLDKSVNNVMMAPKTEVVEDDTPSVTYRLETIYFENGSSVVDAKYNSKIRTAVKQAKADNASIRVLGYASSRTRNTDAVSHKLANFKVSLDRAEAVAKALKRAGMPVEKISVEALADTAPAYMEVMPEGERLNRRAEIYISY